MIMKDHVFASRLRLVGLLLAAFAIFGPLPVSADISADECRARSGAMLAPNATDCENLPDRFSSDEIENRAGWVCCEPTSAPAAPTGDQCTSEHDGTCKSTCQTTEKEVASDCPNSNPKCCVDKTCSELGGQCMDSGQCTVTGDNSVSTTDCTGGLECCVRTPSAGGGTLPTAGDTGAAPAGPTGTQAAPKVSDKGKTVMKYGLRNPLGTRTVPEIVASVVSWLSVLAGGLFFLYLVWGGIQWMAARGDEKMLKAARQKILYAVLGIVVILLSYFAVDALVGLTNVIG